MADDYDEMFDDEEQWLAAWDEVDREAADVLRDACRIQLTSAPPRPDLQRAAAALRVGVADDRWPFYYFVAACGWDGALPPDDVEAWVEAAAATISPRDDPGAVPEGQSAIFALEHADWLGMVVGLVRHGVGARFSAEGAHRDIETMPEIDGVSDEPDAEFSLLRMAVTVLTPLWQALGILGEDGRLTELGRWGLPQGLLATWSMADAHGESERLDEADTAVALQILGRHPMPLEDLRRELAKESVFADVERLHRSLIGRVDTFAFDDGAWGYIPTLADGIVLAHRLTEAECELAALGAGLDLDLWGVMALDGHPFTGGGEVTTRFARDGVRLPDDSGIAMTGPDGWLDGFAPGVLIGLRYVDGVLDLDAVTPAQGTDDDVATVGAVAWTLAELDAAEGDPDFPGASSIEVVLGVRRGHPDVFRAPLPPLSQLLDAAGLEIRDARVGLPGSAWDGEPSWLGEDQRETYRAWQQALRTHRSSGAVPEAEALRALAGSLRGMLLEMAALDLSVEPDREPVAVAMANVVSGPPAAVPLYLRARAAEGRGDGRACLEMLTLAVAADPTSPDAAADLADLKAITGDAREAHRLYALSGLDAGAPEMQVVRKFLQAPEGEVGRNKPCPCGSGKKYKLCHGRTALHPLRDRAGWLWFKIESFAQRGINREVLLEWAEVFSNAAPDDPRTVALAMRDPVTADFAIFDGELLGDFLDTFGSLLPEDERDLAETWSNSERRLLETLEVRPMRGVRVRDLLSGHELEISDRRLAAQVKVKDLMFGRPLPDGAGGLRFRSEPINPPRMVRSRLLALLRADAPAEQIAAFLAPSDNVPELRTSEGEEVVMCTARHELAMPEDAWDRLSSALEAGDDNELVAYVDVPGRGKVLRGTLTRDGSRLTVQTTSIERLRRLQALVLDADPEARLVDESTRPMKDLLEESAGSDAPPEPAGAEQPELTKELLEQIIGQQEEQWLAGPVPALAGRTPREAAADPDLRGEVEALLDDFEWADRQSPQALTMNVSRLRRALGLPGS